MKEGIKQPRVERPKLSPEEKKAERLRRQMHERKARFDGERAQGRRVGSYLYEDLSKYLAAAQRMPEGVHKDASVSEAYAVIFECLKDELADAESVLKLADIKSISELAEAEATLKLLSAQTLKRADIESATAVADIWPLLKSAIEKEVRFRILIFDDHVAFIVEPTLKQVGPIPDASNTLQEFPVELPKETLQTLKDTRDRLAKALEEPDNN